MNTPNLVNCLHTLGVEKCDAENACDLLEDVMLFSYELFRADTVADYVAASLIFLKLRVKGSLALKLCKKNMNDFFSISNLGLTLQSAEIRDGLDKSKSMLENWPRLKASPLWKKIHHTVSYITAMSAMGGKSIDPLVGVKIANEHYTSTMMMNLDFSHTLLDLLLFVVEKGFQSYSTGRLDTIFHSENSYEKWYEDSMDVICKERMFGNPEAFGIDIHSVIEKTDTCISQGQSMLKFGCDLDKYVLKTVRAVVMQLQMVKYKHLSKTLAMKTRKAPLSILVYGHSSVAKTLFMDILHYYYASVRRKSMDPGCRYVKNCVADYWDGFRTFMFSILIDDIAFMNPSKVNELDATLAEILRIVNNAPYCPNQASLEDKGTTPLMCEILVTSTNVRELHANEYFAYPYALTRRFPYVFSVRPRDELRKDRISIDPAKLFTEEGEIPDYWLITVLAPTPNVREGGPIPAKIFGKLDIVIDDGVVLEDIGMEHFLQYYAKVIANHCATQDKVTRCVNELQFMKTCERCFKVVTNHPCSCPEEGLVLQSSIQEISCFVTIFSFLLNWFIYFCLYSFRYRIFGTFSFFCLIQLCKCFDALPRAAQHIYAQAIFQARLKLISFVGRRRYESFKMPITMGVLAQIILLMLAARTAYGSIFPELKKKDIKPCNCRDCIALKEEHVNCKSTEYVTRNDKAPVLQGGVSSLLGRKPVSLDEPECVWKQNAYKIDTFDVGGLTPSWKGRDIALIHQAVLKNCITLRFRKDSSWVVAKAFYISGSTCVTTNHGLPIFDSSVLCEVIVDPLGSTISSNLFFKLGVRDVKRHPHLDIVFITVRCLPPKRDMLELFPSDTYEAQDLDGCYLGVNDDGSSMSVSFKGAHKGYFTNPQLGNTCKMWMAKVQESTRDGDCGAIAVAQSPMGPVILGIHQWLNIDTVGMISLSRSFVEANLFGSALANLAPLMGTKSSTIVLQSKMHTKSVVNFTDSGHALLYGSFVGFRNHGRSKVTHTMFYDDFTTLGCECNYGPPVMSGWKPWQNTFQQLIRNDCLMDPETLYVAKSALLADWCDGSGEDDPYFDLHILDLDTAVNGCPGLRYIDSVQRSTSAGFPWRKSKKHLFTFKENGGLLEDQIQFNDEVIDRVDTILERYARGERTFPIFTCSLKDEATKQKKIDSASTRVFMCSPVDFLLVCRMLLLSFVRVVQTHKTLFESAPGLVAQGKEWHDLYNYLATNGISRCIFGDFSGYDKTMTADVLLAAFDIIESYHRFMGCSEEHCKMIKCLGCDIVFALCDFNGDLIQFLGKNPSGHALTVIINGIVNCIYMRYVFLMLAAKLQYRDGVEIESFKKHVKLITYGDDNGMSVSEDCPWFNHTAISLELSKFGVVYTMAEKGSESKPYVNLCDGSFLKRKWRFDEEIGAYVCPLAMDSIFKSLMINTVSVNISVEEHASALLRTQNGEFFWHGHAAFDMWHNIFLGLIVKHELQDHFADLPLETWDVLHLRYKTINEKYDGGLQLSMKLQSKRVLDTLESLEEWRYCSFCHELRMTDFDMCCYWCGEDDQCYNCLKITKCLYVCRFLAVGMYMPLYCGACARAQEHTYPPNMWLNLSSYKAQLASELKKQITKQENLETGRVSRIESVPTLNGTESGVDSSQNEYSGLRLQAGLTQMQETGEFDDNVAQEVIGGTIVPRGYYGDDRTTMGSLADFLARPVLIHDFAWDLSARAESVIDPWTEYLNKAEIKYKLNNYAFFRGNLHLKVIVNASPFLYGHIKAIYTPLPVWNTNDTIMRVNGNILVADSQKKNVDIYPQENKAGEMVCPFFSPFNYVDITAAADVAKLGKLSFLNYQDLASANDGSAVECSVAVYAWCTETDLMGPTVGLAMQSKVVKDEYGVGAISRPASMIAKAAGSLVNAPIIGMWALATQIGAQAVGAIATMFGWSTVPVIVDITPVRVRPYCDLSTVGIGDCTTKMTLDPKGENTVDPRICGLDGTDELTIQNVVAHESFLYSAEWDTDAVAGDLIMFAKVRPDACRKTLRDTVIQCITPTPMAMVGEAFYFWRGSIIYRFKIICTRYHRGRLRITWDPVASLDGTDDYTHVAKTTLYDIEDGTDIEFVVPYVQKTPWLYTAPMYATDEPVGVVYDPRVAECDNGTLTVRVLTNLTAPVDVSFVTVQMYVKGGPDMAFANPREITKRYSNMMIQSKEVFDVESKVATACVSEEICSLRKLLQRSTLHSVLRPTFAATGAGVIYNHYFNMMRFPTTPGYDPSAYPHANGVVTVSTKPFNYAYWSYLTWFAPMFVARRGSIRWHLDLPANYQNLFESARIDRTPNLTIAANGASLSGVSQAIVATSANLIQGNDWLNTFTNCSSGVDYTNIKVAPTLAVEMPHISIYKFQSTNPLFQMCGSPLDSSSKDTYEFNCKTSGSMSTGSAAGPVTRFVCAGTDFNLHYLLNAPYLEFNATSGSTPL